MAESSQRRRKHRSAGEQDELAYSPKQYAIFLTNHPDMISSYIDKYGISAVADGRPQNRIYRILFYLYYGFGTYECWYCHGTAEKLEHVHHIDHNPWNNTKNNLAMAHVTCHNQHHHRGMHHDEDARQRIGDTLREGYASGRIVPSDQSGENNGFFGKTHTRETRSVLSEARKEFYANGGKNWNEGLAHSDKTVKKISESVKNLTRVWCDQCQRDWPPSAWNRHISKYHEGGSWDKSSESSKRRSESRKNIARIWCDDCQRDWNPGSWPRHIRRYHEGGRW